MKEEQSFIHSKVTLGNRAHEEKETLKKTMQKRKYIGNHVGPSGAPQHVFNSASLHFSFHQPTKVVSIVIL